MNINVISNYFLQSDPRLQKEAFDYFESLKLDVNGWKVCVESLLNSKEQLNDSAIFFCLQVIEDYVRTRYDTDMEENRTILRAFIFTWFTRSATDSVFILNKYALVVNATFLCDFPSQRWDNFFGDFLNICQTESNCDQFLRILLQINADVADREIPRTPKENDRNNLIKDKMRETCLLKLAEFWFNIIERYRDSSPALVCLCLNVIGAYVAWIDISLITNDCVMSNLFSLFSKPEYRCSVCDCFNGILHKGMDPQAKVRLIEQFMEVDVIKLKFENISGVMTESDLEFILKLSKLFNTIGIELVDSGKKLKPKQSPSTCSQTDELIAFINHAVEQKFGVLCQFLSCKNYFVSLQVHPFARDYIQWLKNTKAAKSNTEDAVFKQSLVTLLKIVISNSSYPLEYNFDNEEESEFDECRKSLRILFENLMLLNSAVCIDFLCSNLFEPILGNWRVTEYTFSQVEVSLYFLYLVGENFNILPDQKKIEALVQLVVTSSISTYPHFAVQLMYFEIILRYEKYFSNTLNLLVPQVLISFLDERGFKNSSLKVRSRVSNIFNKFVKTHIKTKGGSKLQSFAEDVIKRLQDFLKLDVTEGKPEGLLNNHNTPKPASIFDDVHYFVTEEDQLLIYETVSILIICNSTFDCPKKQLLMKNLLFEPVWNKFNSVCSQISAMECASPMNNEADSLKIKTLCKQLSHCISLIARTSKAFSNVQTIKSVGAHTIYLDSFNIFVKSLKLNVDEECLLTMQSAARQLLHRLIVCLEETDIVPLLPVAIANIFLPRSYFNAKAIQELVPLINQVVSKFKHSWMFQRDLTPFLKQLFLPTVSCIFTLTADANLAVEERQSLHKSYYTLLHVLVSNGILEVFADLDANVLEQILITLVQGAVEFPDTSIQRSCLFIIKKIIEFQTPININEVNGANQVVQGSFFLQFVHKSVIPACFYALVRQADESQLTPECIAVLKAIQNFVGQNDFCSFIQLTFIPQHFPAFMQVSEMVQGFAGNNDKQLRNSFKSFYHQFKKNTLI